MSSQPPCTAVTTSIARPAGKRRRPSGSRDHRRRRPPPRCPCCGKTERSSSIHVRARRRSSSSVDTTIYLFVSISIRIGALVPVSLCALHARIESFRSSAATGHAVRQPAIRSAVHGASRKAGAAVPGGHQGAVIEPADQRQVVRCHRPQSGCALGQFVLAERRHAPCRRRRAVPAPRPPVRCRRPCSYWVAPTTTPSSRGTRYTCRPCTRARISRGRRHRRRPASAAAALRPSPAGPADPATVRARRCRWRSPPDRPARLAGRHRSAPTVTPRPRARGAARATSARLSTASSVWHGQPAVGCPAPEAVRCARGGRRSSTGWPWAASQSADGAQVGGVGAVRTRRPGMLGAPWPHRRQAVQVGRRSPCHRASDSSPSRSSVVLAGPALAVRGEHAAGHPGRAGRAAGAVHAHRPAGLRRAAGDRQADDAAADDGQRLCEVMSSSLPSPA